MKKVLVIGAGFLQKYVIKRAKDLGYYVYALDGSKNAPGFKYADEYDVINIVDQELCLKYAIEKQVDGVLTAATDYGVLTASYIAREMNLLGVDYEAATIIKNKYLVRKVLFEARADDTQQAYEIKNIEDIENIKSKIILPVMVKPCDGSGSRGASKVEKKSDIEKACKMAIKNSLTKKALIESFIEGNEYGVESFVYDGEITVLAVMKKWMTNAPYYAELGHSIPSRLDDDTEEYIKNCVKKAIKALNVNFGSINMDLLLTKEGKVHIVDIGARMGGNLIGSHLIPIGTGVDYMGAMIKATVGETPDLTPKKNNECVVTRLLALTPGKIESLPDFYEIEKELEVEIHHHLTIGDKISEYHTNLDGCGYIVAKSNSYKVAEQKAEKALIRIDRDIGRGDL